MNKQTAIPRMVIGPRLKRCFEAGDVLKPTAAKDLDKSIQEKRIEITNTASEIYSMLYCYPEDRSCEQ